jgi:dihydroorotate dehydrogenase
MYKWLKPLIFRTNPERAHYAAMGLLQFACAIPGGAAALRWAFRAPRREVNVWGLRFPNPVGLAAGFDKDARWLPALRVLGFGFVEVGTLTPLGQIGNPKPRLFRLPEDRAILNRMGFNNGGVQAAVERLKRRPAGLIVGGNIGKNKATPNENAIGDYLKGLDALHPYVDYFTINVSSPNTPGLRELQDREPLAALLRAVVERNRSFPKPRPVLLKIAPDMTDGQLDDVIAIVQEVGVDGVIATNTTIDRSGLRTEASCVEALGAGGVSGAPVRERSTEVIRYLHERSGGAFPIIGVGGIDSPKAAQEKLDAGATLVQVYSGMVYEGPGLVQRIVRQLA